MKKGKYLAQFGIICGIAALLIIGLPAQASRIDELREQLAQRRAEREAARNIVRPDPDEEKQPDGNSEVNGGQEPCSCSAGLGLAKPDVTWSGNSIVFRPRFNVDIRVRGNSNGAPWNVALDYEGESQFSSNNLTPPPSSSFSGHKDWSGQCFNTSHRLRSLSGEPVNLAALARSLFSSNEAELDALVRLDASLSGCDADLERGQYNFSIQEFGNIDLGRWRRVR